MLILAFLSAAFVSSLHANEPVEGQEVGKVLGKFRNTHYYVALEADYPTDVRDVEVRTLSGEVIAMVSQKYRRAVDIEGSGKLMDGRVINYAGKKDGEVRYHLTIHPYGRGVGNCALVPFRTVAVDPQLIPLGSVVHIAETEGMVLRGTEVHDGLWRAEDIGGAIKNDRIDLFVGEGDRGRILREHGITHLRPLTVKLVEPAPPRESSCVGAEPR